MHDGSIFSLEQVIDFYAVAGRNVSEGQFRGDGRDNPFKSQFVKGFELTEQEKRDLIAFLNALTDEKFIRNPAFSNPFKSVLD